MKVYSKCNPQCRVGLLPADIRGKIDEAFLKGMTPLQIANSPEFKSLVLSESGIYRHTKHIFHRQLIPDEQEPTPVNFVPRPEVEAPASMGVSDLIDLATSRVRELENTPNRNATQERQLLDWTDKLNKALDLALKTVDSNETVEQQKMKLIGWEIGHYFNSPEGQLQIQRARERIATTKYRWLHAFTPTGTHEIQVPDDDPEYNSPDVQDVLPRTPTRSIDDPSVQQLLQRLGSSGSMHLLAPDISKSEPRNEPKNTEVGTK